MVKPDPLLRAGHRERLRQKFQDSKLPLVDEVLALDVESRKNKTEADNLRASRNKNSKMIGALMAQGKKEEAEEMKKQVSEAAQKLAELEEGYTISSAFIDATGDETIQLVGIWEEV